VGASERYLSRPWLKHYQEGVPASVEVPLKSVSRVFDEATERTPERTAVVFYGRSITYRELREATDRLACALAELGVKKGDRVALYLVNSPQFIIAYFAALKCGATVTPISPVYTSHELRYQLEDSGARAVICQDVLYEKVAKAGVVTDLLVVTSVAEYLPVFKRLFSRKLQTPPQAHQLQDLLKRYPPRPPDIAVDPKTDIAALPYTGGTTGNPKGVMLTHYNLVAALVAARKCRALRPKNPETRTAARARSAETPGWRATNTSRAAAGKGSRPKIRTASPPRRRQRQSPRE
jgi:long-chain acyl-CoA synthetase